MIDKIMFSIVTVLVAGLLQYGFVYQHEKTHEMIGEYHGCEESITKISVFEGYYHCSKYREGRSKELWLQEIYLHSKNEIIGYHAQAIMFFLLVTSFFYANYLIWKDN